VSTSDRLLSVLDLFTLERPDWSVEEAAAALQVAISTTYRYVAALSAKGLLAPLGDGRYVLGPTIIHYDRQIRLTDPLISAAHNEMQRLAEMNFGRTIVFICRLLGGQVMCVDQVSQTDLPMGFGYERGRFMPLFAGAASKIILARTGNCVRSMSASRPLLQPRGSAAPGPKCAQPCNRSGPPDISSPAGRSMWECEGSQCR
jgi:DNA-binding IclR family transcriptional regulator